jgi:hypothetical protein
MQTREVDALDRLLRQVEETPAHRRLLQLANVTHVVALHESTFRDLDPLKTVPGPFHEPIRVYGVPDPLPRTYVAAAARRATGEAALAALVDPGLDPRREVVLDPGAGAAGLGGDSDPAAEAGGSRIVEEAPNRIVIECDLERPAFVVLSDAYDPGWRVHVDGAPAALLRANVAFRAVWVAAGHHRIEQAYRPRSVLLGSVLTLAAATLGLATAATRPTA